MLALGLWLALALQHTAWFDIPKQLERIDLRRISACACARAEPPSPDLRQEASAESQQVVREGRRLPQCGVKEAPPWTRANAPGAALVGGRLARPQGDAETGGGAGDSAPAPRLPAHLGARPQPRTKRRPARTSRRSPSRGLVRRPSHSARRAYSFNVNQPDFSPPPAAPRPVAISGNYAAAVVAVVRGEDVPPVLI